MEYGSLQAQTMDAFAQFCTPHFYNHHPTQRGTPGPAGWAEPAAQPPMKATSQTPALGHLQEPEGGLYSARPLGA